MDSGPHQSVRLEFDRIGNPHIIYGVLGSNWMYATRINGVWNTSNSGIAESPISMAVDARGIPQLSYVGFTGGGWRPRYAAYRGGQWLSQEIEAPCDEDAFYSGGAIAIDQAGRPGVAYYSDDFCSAWDGIKFAKKSDRHWATSWGKARIAGEDLSSGTALALTFDASHAPHICFTSDDQALGYVTKTGNEWIVETVDSEGSVGWGRDIAVDSLGQPYISYTERPSGSLRLAVKEGGAWHVELIDSGVSSLTSVSVAPDGTEWIGYSRGGMPRYARRSGSVWELGVIPGATCCSPQARLALDAVGRPSVAFVDGDGLKYSQATLFALPTVEEPSDLKPVGAANGFGPLHDAAAIGIVAIRFQVAFDQGIAFDVFDVSGRRVRTFARATWPAGNHSFQWDGRDDQGEESAPGVYVLRACSDSRTESARILLIR